MAKNKGVKNRHPEAVYFTDVSIIQDDHVLFTAQYYALEDSTEEKTALISLKNGEWGGTNLQGIAHAIGIDNGTSKERTIYVLDRNRAVYKLDSSIKGDWLRINETRQGFLMDLQKIGSDWYAVGGHHQVYREKGVNWKEIDKDIYLEGSEGESVLLTTIAGGNESDIYVAGTNGVIFHYDGASWTALDTPTNLGIQKLLYVSDGYVYACGYANLLMKGNQYGWEIITEPDDSVTFWDMAQFKDELFVCSKNKLFKLSEKGELLEVIINAEGPFAFYRMDSNSNQLWTVGNECILKYDGATWEQFKFPLNEL